MTNQQLIDELRLRQRTLWSQLLETPDHLDLMMLYEATKKAADAWEGHQQRLTPRA